jgi:AcrR family transcriptional regulator/DNA-binding MarR family transcriptional regulator
MPRSQVAEIQRTRLLSAAVRAVEEFGYEGTTVAHITRRARVSRRTFYELFANREECLAAVLEDVVALIEGELVAADLGGLAWRERVRMGLWTILSFFDREPALARMCVVQALRGGPAVLERREQILDRLVTVLDEGRLEGARAGECSSVTAEGLVGAALGILHTRLLRDRRRPLRDLLGELMGMIVLPYLGPAAARREQAHPAPITLVGGRPTRVARAGSDPLDGISMRLTYRTARVLEGIGACPGASNREIADHAEIADQGQVSKLLARLERLGLLVNQGEGHLKGEPNAWLLTPRGEQVAQSIRLHRSHESRAA